MLFFPGARKFISYEAKIKVFFLHGSIAIFSSSKLPKISH
jgi:hypothetical protein